MDSKGELTTQKITELSLATQLIWSSVRQARDILGKDAILTKTGDVDGDPCFLIALPLSRWQLVGKTPIPKELIEADSGSVGNSGALAIDPGSVGNSEKEDESPALAISESEEE